MADDDRRDHDRNRGAYYGQEEWRSGPGGGQRGESFHQGSGPGQGETPGGYGGGQSYGQAGGYNQSPGQSYGGFGGGQAGSSYGQGGFGGLAQGQQSYADGRGQGQGYGGERGYSGQTGTGYGQTVGGGPREDSPEGGLWDKARHAVSGVFGGAEQPQGQHRGRGPKGYSRSDERIHDDVNDRLTDDPFLDATHIEVAVQGGEVTLSGTVTARADKRRAEDLADNVSGVKHVQNNLRVQAAWAEPNRSGSVQESSAGASRTGPRQAR